MVKIKIILSFSKIFALMVFIGCFIIDMAYMKGFSATAIAIPFCSALIGVKQVNDRLKAKSDENITEEDFSKRE